MWCCGSSGHLGSKLATIAKTTARSYDHVTDFNLEMTVLKWTIFDSQSRNLRQNMGVSYSALETDSTALDKRKIAMFRSV